MQPTIKTSFVRPVDVAGLDPFDIFQFLKSSYPRAFFFETAPMTKKMDEKSRAQSELEPSSNGFVVIGLEAFETLRIRGGRVELERAGRVEIVSGQPMEILGQRLAMYAVSPDAPVPYLNGGAFGCLGYDCVRHMEPVLNRSGYFRHLDGSETLEAEIFFSRRLIVFDMRAERAHIVLDTDNESEFLRLKTAIVRAQRPKSSVTKKSRAKKPKEIEARRLQASLGADGYYERVRTLKEHIRAGDIFQAVLAERFELPVQASSLEIFSALRRISPTPYRFHFEFQSGAFFGSSPEALLRLQDNELETHPIAGTRPRGETAARDQLLARQLRRSVKEKAEHLMLVDLARNDLGRVATPGTVRVETFMELHRFRSVMHLVSTVKGELGQGVSPLRALMSCFPAGTLSGAPKIRAMEILAGLEKVPRGFYGGAVVAFGFEGSLESCIAIRSMEMQGRKGILRAGAGIVADSRPEFEYQEVQHKLHVLRLAIAEAERMATESVGDVETSVAASGAAS